MQSVMPRVSVIPAPSFCPLRKKVTLASDTTMTSCDSVPNGTGLLVGNVITSSSASGLSSSE
eukprot:682385-Rhodomonas_salina.3